ncbi:MAG: amidohydrolase family protein [Gammaproteobacteria bacterium]
MKTTNLTGLMTVMSLGLLQSVAAQDLVIRNARALDGNGGVVDSGTIVIRNGRISAYEEDLTTADFPVLDARGETVIPAFTDAHRQVIQGDPDEWMDQAAERMQEYLEAGFTTLVTTDESLDHILVLRDQLESSEIEGPRLLVTGSVPLTSDSEEPVAEEAIREAVRNLALEGLDGIASTVRATPGGRDRAAMSVARDEANEQGLLAITHIESVEDALAAVQGDSGYLTSTPHAGHLDEDSARNMVEAGRSNAEYGLVMTSTLGAIASESPGPANARMLWDAGIIYGFGTNTTLPPEEALRHELTALLGQFSNEEIFTILTKNAALASRRDDALGTLDRGKFADILVLSGDPLADVEHLFDIQVVIKTGRIVVDNR